MRPTTRPGGRKSRLMRADEATRPTTINASIALYTHLRARHGLATTVDEQHALQNKIRDLEKTQRTQRQQIFNVEDQIKGKRDLLIERLEKRLSQHSSSEHLFSIRWQAA